MSQLGSYNDALYHLYQYPKNSHPGKNDSSPFGAFHLIVFKIHRAN